MGAVKMENIIEKLYDLHLKVETFPFGQTNAEDTNREWRLYDYLYKTLNGELKKMFCEYARLNGTRHSEEAKNAYMYGFKTAITLIAEALKE
jgi:hypothetical protein